MELHTSETISDTTNSSTNNELSLSFDVANGGTETVYVDDKLLTNYDVAKARAESIFLDEGYVTKRVTFNTYHIDNLHIGDPIQLDGLLFKVINIVEKIQGAKVSMDITAERAISFTANVSVYFATASIIYYAMSSPDGYMYGGTSSGGQIYRSQDGITWVMVYDDAVFDKVSKIVYNEVDGYLYAALAGTDTRIIKSANGTDWTTITTFSSQKFSDLIFKDNYLYIATYILESGLYTSLIKRTTDMVSISTLLVFDERIYNFAIKDSYLYFSSFNATTESIYQSTDGATFTKISDLPLSDYISVISSYNSHLVGANDLGKIYKSTDGITWEKVVDNAEYNIYTMSNYSNGIYIPTNSGKILYSGDLVIWKEIYDLTGSVGWLWAITSHNGFIFFFDDVSNCYKLTFNGGE